MGHDPKGGFSAQGFEQYPYHDSLEEATEYGEKNLYAEIRRHDNGAIAEEIDVFIFMARGRFVCGRASDMYIQQVMLDGGGGEIVGYISGHEFYPLADELIERS